MIYTGSAAIFAYFARRPSKMKVTISLDKPKVVIVIEGSDTSLAEVSDLVEQALVKIKKVWFDYIKRQTKLQEEKNNASVP